MEPLRQNLRTIAILYYVLAGITALFSLFPLIHVTIGILALTGQMFPEVPTMPDGSEMEMQDPFPDKVFGGIFLGVGSLCFAIGEFIALIFFLTGRKMSNLRSYQFCMVGSAISCVMMPLGTILGVFSLINLNKPEARELFQV